jgi:NIMA (never in mitosis gene a)-related kinase
MSLGDVEGESGRSSMADFVVGEQLGKGSFGTVHRVRRKADRQDYVMKLVHIANLSRKEKGEAIQEVRLLASLDHKHVVRYYDSFVEAGTLSIVMEDCKRGDLHKRLAGRVLPEAVWWKYLLQVRRVWPIYRYTYG